MKEKELIMDGREKNHVNQLSPSCRVLTRVASVETQH